MGNRDAFLSDIPQATVRLCDAVAAERRGETVEVPAGLAPLVASSTRTAARLAPVVEEARRHQPAWEAFKRLPPSRQRQLRNVKLRDLPHFLDAPTTTGDSTHRPARCSRYEIA